MNIITTVRQHLAGWVDTLSEHLENVADWLDPPTWTRKEIAAILGDGPDLDGDTDTYSLGAVLIARGRAEFVSGIEAAKRQIEAEKRAKGGAK